MSLTNYINQKIIPQAAITELLGDDHKLSDLLEVLYVIDPVATRQLADKIILLPVGDDTQQAVSYLIDYWLDQNSDEDDCPEDDFDDEEIPSTTEVYSRALRAFNGNHELAAEAASQYPGDFI